MKKLLIVGMVLAGMGIGVQSIAQSGYGKKPATPPATTPAAQPPAAQPAPKTTAPATKGAAAA